MAAAERCDNCKCYLQDGGKAWCRRYPPQIHPEAGEGQYPPLIPLGVVLPRALPDGWCYEYKPDPKD